MQITTLCSAIYFVPSVSVKFHDPIDEINCPVRLDSIKGGSMSFLSNSLTMMGYQQIFDVLKIYECSNCADSHYLKLKVCSYGTGLGRPQCEVSDVEAGFTLGCCLSVRLPSSEGINVQQWPDDMIFESP